LMKAGIVCSRYTQHGAHDRVVFDFDSQATEKMDQTSNSSQDTVEDPPAQACNYSDSGSAMSVDLDAPAFEEAQSSTDTPNEVAFDELTPLDPPHVVQTPAPTISPNKAMFFSSPLMRALVMQLLTPPNKPVQKLLFENWLDCVTLVVPMMDFSSLRESLSTKRSPEDRDSYVLSEHAYHYEFHRTFNYLLPLGYTASSQVGGSENDMGNNRLDMVVNSRMMVGIEITAHTTKEDNQAHANRFELEYANLNLKAMGVIHFTSDEDGVEQFPTNQQHFTHIVHNQNFTQICLYDKSGVVLVLEKDHPFVWRNDQQVTPPELQAVLPHVKS